MEINNVKNETPSDEARREMPVMKPSRSGKSRWGTLAARVVEMRFRFSSPAISKTGSFGDTGLFAFVAIKSCR